MMVAFFIDSEPAVKFTVTVLPIASTVVWLEVELPVMFVLLSHTTSF